MSTTVAVNEAARTELASFGDRLIGPDDPRYDEASRVPFIISRKGVTKPGVSNRLAHTGVDLIPTFCDFAGIETPKGLPGLSLKKTALGRGGEDPREYLVISNKLVQGAPIDGHKPEPGGRMVRSQRYKYCAYDEGERRESLEIMVTEEVA